MDGAVVGHILFSRMWVDAAGGSLDAVCLAPVAVAPPHQRRGIGSLLISRGVDEVRRLGERLVIVVGHPEDYPRFGFEPAQPRGLSSPFPPEAFMVIGADGWRAGGRRWRRPISGGVRGLIRTENCCRQVLTAGFPGSGCRIAMCVDPRSS